MIIQGQVSYQGGALRLLAAKRPATLPAQWRDTRPLESALPRGLVRAGLRLAAWFALPIPIASGVYRVGTPGPDDPVLLTGNFLATVEKLRLALAGQSCYLIVEDTSGWNVWCASDAGLFTAERAAALMRLYGIERLTPQRTVIIPRLGGRVGKKLTELTQWHVVTGPIEARDLPDFLKDATITPEMRNLDRMYRLPERLRVGALTMVQLPLFLLPFRFFPAPVRRSVWRFAVVASWVLSVFHYQTPGRTGIVKGTALGGGVGLALLIRNRKYRAHAIAILLCAPLIGWIYQSSCPVIFWKRIWK